MAKTFEMPLFEVGEVGQTRGVKEETGKGMGLFLVVRNVLFRLAL